MHSAAASSASGFYPLYNNNPPRGETPIWMSPACSIDDEQPGPCLMLEGIQIKLLGMHSVIFVTLYNNNFCFCIIVGGRFRVGV